MRRRPNPDSEANIRRIDTKARAKKQTHGFQVHFLRGTQMVTKMFSDSIYGGKEAARRAARKFRRTVVRRLPQRRFDDCKGQCGIGRAFFLRYAFQHTTNPGAKSSGRAAIQPSMTAGKKKAPLSISIGLGLRVPWSS